MESKELTCIGCPLGCMVHIELLNGKINFISGNACPRGEQYARKEITNPTRIVTSSVKVINGRIPMVSVKTKEDIPKDKIKDCMEALKYCVVTAPVYIGDIIIENVAGTNVSITATKNVEQMMLNKCCN